MRRFLLRWRVAGAALIALAALALVLRDRGHGARVLWWRGVAVRWAGAHGVALGPEGLLLAFTPGGVPRWLPVAAGARTLLEASVDGQGTIWLVDGGGGVVRRQSDGSLQDVGRTAFDVPTVVAGPHGFWAARSAVQFTFRPEEAVAPLAVRLASPGDSVGDGAAGRVLVPDNPFLTQLTNASRLLALPDGGVIVAPFVRDEVSRFDRDGRELWRATRRLAHATPNPTLLVRPAAGGGSPRVLADYAPVNLGLALGPDGVVYVLSTVAARTDSSRLDALDLETGALRRTWRFGTAQPTLVAGADGSVSLAEADTLIAAGEGAGERLAPFVVPTPVAGDSLRLDALAGKVVLVNFWASWCGPCRDELPALDSLAGVLDTGRVRVVGLTDDLSRAAADRFLAERRIRHLAIGYGDGGLKARYHYVGLPLTVLLDGEGRVLRRWIGYAGHGQIVELGEAVRRAGGGGGGGGDSAVARHVH